MGGSDEWRSSKYHYDISMSKRTRKPLVNVQASDPTPTLTLEAEDVEEKRVEHKSLEQLINGDNKAGGRNSLGEHFTEEEKHHLQLVKTQKHGVKLKTVVNRYAKVLSHMIKFKRQPPPPKSLRRMAT